MSNVLITTETQTRNENRKKTKSFCQESVSEQQKSSLKTVGIQSSDPLKRRPPFKSGPVQENTQVFLSVSNGDNSKLIPKKETKSIPPSMLTNFSEIKPKKKSKSRTKSSKSMQAACRSTKNSVFDASKILKQPSNAKNYKLDFDSRWEYFLELKTLDEARNRIYCSAFFQVWKALFRKRYVERMEQTASQIESSLNEFNSTHIPGTNYSYLLRQNNQNLSQENSTYRSRGSSKKSLPKGYSYSSVSTSEARVEDLQKKYRKNNNFSSDTTINLENFAQNNNNKHTYDDNSRRTRAYVSESVIRAPIRKVKKKKHTQEKAIQASNAPSISNSNEQLNQIEESFAGSQGHGLVKDITTQLRTIANFNNSLNINKDYDDDDNNYYEANEEEEEEDNKDFEINDLNESADFINEAKRHPKSNSSMNSDNINLKNSNFFFSNSTSAQMRENSKRARQNTSSQNTKNTLNAQQLKDDQYNVNQQSRTFQKQQISQQLNKKISFSNTQQSNSENNLNTPQDIISQKTGNLLSSSSSIHSRRHRRKENSADADNQSASAKNDFNQKENSCGQNNTSLHNQKTALYSKYAQKRGHFSELDDLDDVDTSLQEGTKSLLKGQPKNDLEKDISEEEEDFLDDFIDFQKKNISVEENVNKTPTPSFFNSSQHSSNIADNSMFQFAKSRTRNRLNTSANIEIPIDTKLGGSNRTSINSARTLNVSMQQNQFSDTSRSKVSSIGFNDSNSINDDLDVFNKNMKNAAQSSSKVNNNIDSEFDQFSKFKRRTMQSESFMQASNNIKKPSNNYSKSEMNSEAYQQIKNRVDEMKSDSSKHSSGPKQNSIKFAENKITKTEEKNDISSKISANGFAQSSNQKAQDDLLVPVARARKNVNKNNLMQRRQRAQSQYGIGNIPSFGNSDNAYKENNSDKFSKTDKSEVKQSTIQTSSIPQTNELPNANLQKLDNFDGNTNSLPSTLNQSGNNKNYVSGSNSVINGFSTASSNIYIRDKSEIPRPDKRNSVNHSKTSQIPQTPQTQDSNPSPKAFSRKGRAMSMRITKFVIPDLNENHQSDNNVLSPNKSSIKSNMKENIPSLNLNMIPNNERDSENNAFNSTDNNNDNNNDDNFNIYNNLNKEDNQTPSNYFDNQSEEADQESFGDIDTAADRRDLGYSSAMPAQKKNNQLEYSEIYGSGTGNFDRSQASFLETDLSEEFKSEADDAVQIDLARQKKRDERFNSARIVKNKLDSSDFGQNVTNNHFMSEGNYSARMLSDNEIYKMQMTSLIKRKTLIRDYLAYLMGDEEYNEMIGEAKFHEVLTAPFPDDVYEDVFTPNSVKRKYYLKKSSMTPLINYFSKQIVKNLRENDDDPDKNDEDPDKNNKSENFPE